MADIAIMLIDFPCYSFWAFSRSIYVIALLFAVLMAHFPAPPSWVHQAVQALGGQALPRPTQPWRLVLPCAGIDAPGRAVTELGVEAKCVGIWDSDEKNCGPVLRQRFGKDNPALHLGESGDIMRVAPASIPDADGLISGPPCPPFSSGGKRLCFDDARARVFDQVIVWIKELYKRGLLFFIIENVEGMMKKKKGSAFNTIFRQQFCFVCDVWKQYEEERLVRDSCRNYHAYVAQGVPRLHNPSLALERF